jgi:hypothetical protein
MFVMLVVICEGRQSNAQTGQGKETVQHTVTRVEDQTPNHDNGEIKTQVEFKEVIFGRNRRRQRHQVMIGTSRDSQIRAVKKAWIYLGRMTRDTALEGVRIFLDRRGIKEEKLVEELKTMGPYKAFKLDFPFEYLRLTENPEFWPIGTIIRPFRINHRTRE